MTRSVPISSSSAPAGDDNHERFRWAMAASRTGMAIIDPRGHLLEANPAFAEMLGYRPEELIGRPVSAVMHSENLVVRDLIAGLSTATPARDGETENADELEHRFLHRDGSVVWTWGHVGVMRDTHGSPRLLMVEVRDLTARHAADVEGQISAARREAALDEAQQQLQLFADAVAHDLRAPLRSIGSFSALLAARAADRLDETDRDYLRRIRAAAERMSGLLLGLSELSGVTRAELKPAAVDLSLLAEWVGAELQDAEPARQVELVVQPGLSAWGDEHLLKQLLTQLLGNAWKFSRERDSVRIKISGERFGDAVRLQVHDAGIGFDPRYAHKLFEPFQRLHGPDQGGGHGLGLAIAQRIAQRHGGHIRAESQPQKGATFIVELPVVAVAEDAPHA